MFQKTLDACENFNHDTRKMVEAVSGKIEAAFKKGGLTGNEVQIHDGFSTENSRKLRDHLKFLGVQIDKHFEISCVRWPASSKIHLYVVNERGFKSFSNIAVQLWCFGKFNGIKDIHPIVYVHGVMTIMY